MTDQYITWPLDRIRVGEPLPGDLFVYIQLRFITLRANGDTLDRNAYDRLEFKKVAHVFIRESDKDKFTSWSSVLPPEVTPEHLAKDPLDRKITLIREETKRKVLDIFQSAHPDKTVTALVGSSKKMVMEIMRNPFAIQNLSKLQTFSRGTVDHSVNVSILSTYLAMQLGYSHAMILQHVSLGALLHDLGKTMVPLKDNMNKNEIALALRTHPSLGKQLLDKQEKVPMEVKLIVEQHHEQYNGGGYPKGLRRNEIYDLARLVSIANVFDGLVCDGSGTLVERQKKAVRELDETHYKSFDPAKLEKVLRVLRLGV